MASEAAAGHRSQPAVAVLHILSQAVQSRLLALGLKDVVALPGGFLSGPRQLPPERVSGQEVKDRIHAAVEARQPPRHLVGGVDAVVELAHVGALEVQPGPHVQVLHHVEGQVGDGEDRQHDDDQVDGFLTQGRVVHVIADQRFDDHAVAAEYDDERDAEAEHGQSHAVDEVTGELILGGGVVAGGRVALGARPGVIEDGGDGYDDDHPHQGAGDDRVFLLQPAQRLERVHHPGVPVHADAGQKQDTPVEVHVEYEALQAAQHVTEYPVGLVEVVEDEEGQREDVAEVSQGQVEHVDGDAAPGSHVAHEHPDGQAVAHQPRDEDHDVDGGQVVELEARLGEGASSSRVVVEIGDIQERGQVQVCGHGVRGRGRSFHCGRGDEMGGGGGGTNLRVATAAWPPQTR